MGKQLFPDLNERIRKLRKVLDLTQQEFADKIGLKQNSIALIESGKRNPSTRTMYAICRAFNVNDNWLTFGEGEIFEPLPKSEEMQRYVDSLFQSDDTIAQSVAIAVLKSYCKLDESGKEIVRQSVREMVDRIKYRDELNKPMHMTLLEAMVKGEDNSSCNTDETEEN